MPEHTSLSSDDIEVSLAAPDDASFYLADPDPSDPVYPVYNRRNGDLMY
jgi:hypothetical protein